MIYYHVDVFSAQPLSGNGLTVIMPDRELDTTLMQRIAQEFKQFETIFLSRTGEKSFRARIFTVEEELDFAGHPILGAAAAIHEEFFSQDSSLDVLFELNAKNVDVRCSRADGCHRATMNQGVAQFLGVVPDELQSVYLSSLSLSAEQLHPALPMEVVSTGLPYLIVPLSHGLELPRIAVRDLERQLSKVGAKFAYLLDVDALEGRTWDNLGAVEDVATGSAAGPVGAYLVRHKQAKPGEPIELSQGRFAGRPSRIHVLANPNTGEIVVAGDARIIVKGTLVI